MGRGMSKMQNDGKWVGCLLILLIRFLVIPIREIAIGIDSEPYGMPFLLPHFGKVLIWNHSRQINPFFWLTLHYEAINQVFSGLFDLLPLQNHRDWPNSIWLSLNPSALNKAFVWKHQKSVETQSLRARFRVTISFPILTFDSSNPRGMFWTNQRSQAQDGSSHVTTRGREML